MKEYSLWVHWKQGDEFHDLLEESKGDVSKALERWSEIFEERAKFCVELASRLKGKNVKADADTHYIGLYGDEKVLDKLAKEGLINVEEFEEEE